MTAGLGQSSDTPGAEFLNLLRHSSLPASPPDNTTTVDNGGSTIGGRRLRQIFQ